MLAASVVAQEPPLQGLADYHLHQFAYLGFGGNAISHTIDPITPCLPTPPFGSTLSVKDLVRNGLFDSAAKQFANGDCRPTVWSAASQRVDTDNLKRAWQYGLRLVVVLMLSAEFLCETGQLAPNCPPDRRAIEQQIQAARALEKRIDMEAGGAGLGWYRIATTPAEARGVIKQGKLAVVLGIEAANAFGCRIQKWTDVPSVRLVPSDTGTEAAYRNNCEFGHLTQEQFSGHARPEEHVNQFGRQSTHMALALFEHYWRLGVRHFYLTHNIDGVASGTAISIDLLHGELNPSGMAPGAPGTDRRGEINRVIKAIRPSFTTQNCATRFPYDGGRCNAAGLTPDGRELALTMAASGAIIDADHLSHRAKRELLGPDGVLKGLYPLVSSHSGISSLNSGNSNNEGQLTEEDIEAIIRSGGAFAPRLPPVTAASEQKTFPENATAAIHECGGTSESFVQAYRYLTNKMQTIRPNTLRPFVAGIGIGTDFGPPIPVFAAPRFVNPTQRIVGSVDVESLIIGRPDNPAGPCFAAGTRPMVTYPITRTSPSASVRTLDKATTPWDGRRDRPGYDISYDGVPHIGMIPDFVEEMRVLGLTDAELQPLWHGAEAYIRAWEAAEAWRSGFDVEAKSSVRQQCEAHRADYLASMDTGHVARAVTALRGMRQNGCRGRTGVGPSLSFAPNEDWARGTSAGSGLFFADVTGDRQADSIVVTTERVTVRRSTGSAFGANEDWTGGPYYGARGTFFADVTGDGRADAIVVNNDRVTVRRSTGSAFGPNEVWTGGPYYGSRGTFFVDVTGDRRADAVVVNDNTVTVRRSTGSTFLAGEDWTGGPYFGARGTFFADVTGDGLADAIVVNNDTVTVRRSTGSAFSPNEDWTRGPYFGGYGIYFADVTGDGWADAIVVNNDTVTVRRSTGSAFSPNEDWTRGPYYGNRGTFFADVTGEGRADAIVVNDDRVTVRRSR